MQTYQLEIPLFYRPKRLTTILEKNSGYIFKLKPAIIENLYIAVSDKTKNKYLVRESNGKFNII